MSKIVFFCIPAHGHTNPTLGVVKELIARGHQVWYYSYSSMEEAIRAAGAVFVPCDAYDPQTDLTPEGGERIGKDLAFSTRLIVDMTLALDDAVLRDMEALEPDVIVADSMAFWGKLIARKLGVPFVSSTTTFAFNRASSQVMKGSQGAGLWPLLKALPKINRSLAKLRAKGYPVKSVLDIIANDNDTETIVYTSPAFQPCADTFSDKYHFVGPSMRPAGEPLPPSPLPTVYLSLGTVVNKRPDFYKNCLSALTGRPWRAILSVGELVDPGALGPLPPNVSVQRRVDQMAVLAAADGFLTHCGMNSVSEALWYGVPLLLFPQTPEQAGVAARVRELGAGLLLESDTPQAIGAALDRLLGEESFRKAARALSEDLRRCGGAPEAARVIEKAAKQ